MMATLLEKALSAPARKTKAPDSEIRERAALALALATGKISGMQFSSALGIKATRVSGTCASILMSSIQKGIIKTELV
jgi:hypothetical protein